MQANVTINHVLYKIDKRREGSFLTDNATESNTVALYGFPSINMPLSSSNVTCGSDVFFSNL